ncbi:S8 family serine peptidase [bacterium]|nr:S8 family serine peptidase [bacterium]
MDRWFASRNYSWHDYHGHETIMAGLVGAIVDEEFGIAGINSESSILISKIWHRGPDWRDFLSAWVPAVTAISNYEPSINKILLLAWATPPLDDPITDCETALGPYPTAYEDAILYGLEHNVLFVFPTGRSTFYEDIGFPAFFAGCGRNSGYENGYPNVLAVASYTSQGDFAQGSPGSEFMTLRGPGGVDRCHSPDYSPPFNNSDIRCATETSSAADCPRGGALNELISHGCQTWDWSWVGGSSAAAANVAGLASLVWSSAPDLTATEICNAIKMTCFNPALGSQGYRGHTNSWGWGAPNSLAAILVAPSAEPADVALLGCLMIDNTIDLSGDGIPLVINRKFKASHAVEIRADVLPLRLRISSQGAIVVPRHGRLDIMLSDDPSASLEIEIEPGGRIVVEDGGQITAISESPANPIRFVGVDSSPENAWRGIYLNGGENVFENCVFENASVAIRASASSDSLTNCQFNDCGIAVAAMNAVVNLTDCSINGGGYGVLAACDSRVTLTNCTIRLASRSGLWLNGFSSCVLDRTIFEENGDTPNNTYFYGGIRNTFGTLTLHCVISRDNYGPGLSALGGHTRMAPATNETGKNTFVNNRPPESQPRAQIYFDNAQFQLCNGRNKVCGPDGWQIMDATPTWHDVTNNYWCDVHLYPAAYENNGDDIAAQDDRCGLGNLGYCMPTIAAALFDEAWIEENTMLYQEAYDGYKYILETYPESPEAKLCPERMMACENGLGQEWEDRRTYFLEVADTTKDPGLEFEAKASAAWCLVEMEMYEDAQNEFLAMLNEADTDYKYQKAALLDLMVELKQAPWDTIGSLDAAPDEDRLLTVLDRMEAVLNGRTHDAPRVSVPTAYKLYQNYPNPFNPTTVIRFDLPEAARVELTIFNIMGQRVATLADELRQAGSHTVTWNGQTGSGVQAAAGIYVYRLRAGDFVASRKMILLK